MEILSCDLETTTNIEHVREWAVGVYNIYTDEFEWGISFEWYFQYLIEIGPTKAYFHNLKFDGGFILDYLLRNGYEYTTNKKLEEKQFSTLISDKNLFYSIKVNLGPHCVTFLDSWKIIPFSVKKISSAFGLSYSKGDIDYHKERPLGYIPTDDEIDYLYRDCKIVAKALKVLFDQNLKRMTQGSNALHSFKKSLPRKFEKIFPAIDCDSEIKAAYKGGFTYVNPKYQGMNVGKGVVYDKNSMYPTMMKYKPMPYDKPKHYVGKYVPNKIYPLYIQKIKVLFEIKKDHIPTIQIKNGFGGFIPTEYVTSSNDEEITLTLTCVDLELFLEQYDIYVIEYVEGWCFKSAIGLFDKYIDYWYNEKEKAAREKNAGMRTLAKLMLNALYGKFATSIKVRGKDVFYDEKEKKVKYVLGDEETRDPVYLPVACFITAYSRENVIRCAQSNYDRFIYADTDSAHLIGTEEPKGMEIDKYKMGAWSREYIFYRGRYLRSKCYIDEIAKPLPVIKKHKNKHFNLKLNKLNKRLYPSHKLQVTCAGMAYECHEYVTWENFRFGQEYNGKKTAKTVRGGVVLVDTTYKLKL